MSNLTIEHINALDDPIRYDAYPECYGAKAMLILKSELCSSENAHACHGPLWKCAECGQIFCCVEGGDKDGLCDTCWADREAQHHDTD